MAKPRSLFVCNQCAYETPKWMGRCPECGNWNSFEEQIKAVSTPPAAHKAQIGHNYSNVAELIRIGEIDTENEVRFHTGVSELDRVLGGGIVKGSLVLLGGDPGIGKSTLLLQICEYLGKNLSILYVSGEESVRQLKLRANRLHVNSDNLSILASTDVEVIGNTILQHKPNIVMIDSIQTMCISSVTSSPGSITQVRESTNAFMRIAKSEDIPIFIVGHVNKDGAIAGPKVLEHIVDAVLYFEGERNLTYRILRAVKNRYGSTNEIGVFEMTQTGLNEVVNPSLMLLSGRSINVSGTCVACVMEGSRPILAEVQALVTKTGFGTPRRTATGFDYNRMNLFLAVLEKRAGYFFGNLDVYINVVGGLRLDEPGADLSVAMSLVSSLRDKPIDDDIIAFGEIGLGGEVRNVGNISDRVKEAERLGFTRAIIPKHAVAQINLNKNSNIEILPVSNIKEAFQIIL
ncbi:DNA repair protein RadA [Paludicola sp. MB14-C6]|uniref:DNA repair protein RadA n=1 Tax=Paludihabitans sp. MB14-C6 TaxID=3070656 RepID=UPI0027DC8CF0|nr:DNA repair protein RadA [Paludicola sp. MB14-C6]WMJ22961.1 DNA repair protein RadA [Paludicola sp. MB14-C6]